MKVNTPEHQSKITLSTMLLELQFSMKLSQLETVIYTYQELIAFCLQYAFLFKNEDSAPIGEVFSQKQERLTTPDPARDGTNWVVYCAANPVGRWDPSGLFDVGEFFAGLGSILGGVVLGGSTIVEDAATGGIGIADDPATLTAASLLIVAGGNMIRDSFKEKPAIVLCLPASTSNEKAIPLTDEVTGKNNQNIGYVHKTNYKPFAYELVNDGYEAIDRKVLEKGDNRFGPQFYVASDKMTADLEKPGEGSYIYLTFSPSARILDLTNPDIAKEYGYQTGQSHDWCRQLMNTWDLSDYDAIKFQSEKGGNFNFAVMNFSIIIPTGVEL